MAEENANVVCDEFNRLLQRSNELFTGLRFAIRIYLKIISGVLALNFTSHAWNITFVILKETKAHFHLVYFFNNREGPWSDGGPLFLT